MNNGIATIGSATMSSIELVSVINSMREEGKAELRHDNFMAKIENHPGIDSPKFLGQYKDSTGRTLKCYYLPKRECELMVMSESLAVQAKVYDRMSELESAALAAPSKADRTAKLSGSHKAALTIAKQAHGLAKAFGFTGNQAILYADKAATGATGISPLAMMGATHLLADQRGMTLTPTELGRERGMSGQAMNKYLFDQGLQVPSAAGTGWEPTPKAAGHYEWLDTGKAYSAGTPIKQLKWFSTVSEFFQNANA